MTALEEKIFAITNESEFTETALAIFRFQYQKNPVYRQFCDYLSIDATRIKSIEEIPFLPIQFFKSHRVNCFPDLQEEIVYTSSGTTGNRTSKHYVNKLDLYKKSFQEAFEQFYGPVGNYAVLALLPSYLEREGSSLIYMADAFIKGSKYSQSGFYLHNLDQLATTLHQLEKQEVPTLLIGVSFALLDLIEKHTFKLNNTIVMETGGMKGKRKEMVRQELHGHLCKGFGVDKIHSEYGMTELLSQAYSQSDGIFHCPNHMKILIREPEDELCLVTSDQIGGVNVIDLANLYSCSFIATQDLGKKLSGNQYEILGRFDHSDVRGCNLLL